MHSSHEIYGLFLTCKIKEGISYKYAHGSLLCHFVIQLRLFEHTLAAMMSTVLLHMSPSWPLPKSRRMQHPLSARWLGIPWWASQAADLA